MSRLTEWVKKLKAVGMTEYDIACGLDNGDLKRPEWLSSSPCTAIGYAIWDNADPDRLYDLDTDPDSEINQ